MDINLARTFLMVAETGSFIDAARKMNVTQSTVSARIKSLEDLLGRPLFERSKNGAELTSSGSQFQKHALALVRVWQHAQLEIGLSATHRDHLSVAAPLSLWHGFLLKWVAWLRHDIPDIAVTASAGITPVLTQRLIEGTLDLAMLYRTVQPPGHVIEHLFDKELVLVSSAKTAPRRGSGDYVFIDWCPEFQEDHASAYPELASPGLGFDLGELDIDYLLTNETSGYFPMRMVKAHLARGRLRDSEAGSPVRLPGLHGLPRGARRGSLRADPRWTAARGRQARLGRVQAVG